MFKSKKEKMNKELIKEEELKDINETSDSTEETSEDNETNETDKLQSEVKDLKDKLLRKAADFENYKRRSEADMTSLYQYANEGLIKDMLPILDDFERVNQDWKQNKDTESLGKSFELLYDKFRKVLDKQGVKELEAKGKDFDVNIHDALMMSPNAEAKPNTVLEVAEKGYLLKDKVIRHAKVIVAVEQESANGEDEK